MNEKAFEGLDGVEIPDNLLTGIAGGVLDEEEQDWLIRLIAIAKRANMTRERLLERVRMAYNDPAEAEELEEVIAFVIEHW